MLVSSWQCQSSILVFIYNCALYSLDNLTKKTFKVQKQKTKKQSVDFYLCILFFLENVRNH